MTEITVSILIVSWYMALNVVLQLRPKANENAEQDVSDTYIVIFLIYGLTYISLEGGAGI